ncbi:family 43 glycosylhydrolase [Sphingomonas sp. Leaf4]|uniref:family 43 glycosylhydrolase n=1 Tax=Sphingomonas sp. Leaf4 TaxID=2876553 RepID=UPI001E30D846|nr:family 43 glycosylhydrolase [Sphingomonas sp. Leaf4]
MRALAALAAVVAGGLSLAAAAPEPRFDAAHAGNPLLPGYFADPSIVRDGNRWYIFATIDPWGGDALGLWTSDNGRDWRFSTPNWPTRAAATSPTSSDAKVWAPSVVKAANGRWYMYVSVGSEVWVGSATSPAGPWADANGGKPLIGRDFDRRYHMIDAEAFVDTDGQAYLYWGSGLNWVNGHCFVVKLKPDMVRFDGPVRDVTPPNYFEGPFMMRQGKHYVLSYSDGKTTEDTYKVRYAIGDTPFGPFREGPGSPILSTDAARNVISPGHHAIFRSGRQAYILYHRHGLPFLPSGDAVLRQVAIDPIRLNDDGTIARVVPGHGGPVRGFAARRAQGLPWRASGQGRDALHGPERAGDDNYATGWIPASAVPPRIVADLGTAKPVRESGLRMGFPVQSHALTIEGSADGKRWTRLAGESAASGSPIVLRHAVRTRYLRLTVPQDATLLEWTIR